MENLPRHIKDALMKRRDEIICMLNVEKFSLPDIKHILEQSLTTQRIHQIIISNRSKQEQNKE